MCSSDLLARLNRLDPDGSAVAPALAARVIPTTETVASANKALADLWQQVGTEVVEIEEEEKADDSKDSEHIAVFCAEEVLSQNQAAKEALAHLFLPDTKQQQMSD